MDYTELLPPLPEPTLEDVPYELWGQNVSADMFTADQLRAYAIAAIKAYIEYEQSSKN